MSSSRPTRWAFALVSALLAAIPIATTLGSTFTRFNYVVGAASLDAGPQAIRPVMPVPVLEPWASANAAAVTIAILTVVIDALLALGLYHALLRVSIRRPSALLIAQCVSGIVLVGFGAALNPDMYAYSIYGILAGVHAINPYTLSSSPLHTSGDSTLSNALTLWGNPPPNDNYGPAWTLLVALVARVTHTLPAWFSIVSAMRLLSLGASLICTCALIRLAGTRRTVAFALSPLVFLESIVNGHNDILMLTPAIWALAVIDEMPLLSALLLGLSVATKYVTVVLLPLLIARIWLRHNAVTAVMSGLVSVVTVCLCFIPFWAGPNTLRSIYDHSGGVAFSVSSLAGSALGALVLAPRFGSHHPSWPWIIDHALIAALIVLVITQIPAFAKRGMADSRPLWRVMIGLLLATPALGPYLLIWFTPMLVANGRIGIFARVLTACGVLSYFVFLAIPGYEAQSIVFPILTVVVPIFAAFVLPLPAANGLKTTQ